MRTRTTTRTTRTSRRQSRAEARGFLRRVALAAAVLLAAAAPAAAWDCRNGDLEIACDAQGCNASESFTPMSISLGEKGEMTVCAYSGCWQGRANQIVQSDDYLILAASALRWNGQSGNDAAIAVLLDKHTGIAILNGAGFAHPLTCSR